MPQQKEKLELKINVPEVINFKKMFKEGDGKWGKWYAWDVLCNGTEMTFFTTDALQDKIKPYLDKNISVLEVIKAEKDDGKGFVYLVNEPGGEKKFNASLDEYNNNEKKEKEDEKWDNIAKGKVRHGVAIAMIEKGANLNPETKAVIDDWVDYIMTGELKTRKSAAELMEEGIRSVDDEIREEDIPF